MSKERLLNQCAIVTGASSGIGRAIALDLASNGANVVINYSSNEQGAKEVMGIIQGEYRRECLIKKADVSRGEEVQEMIQGTIKKFGRVDILVNNAAVHIGGKLHIMREDHWMRVVDVSVKGVYYCCKFTLPHMLERKYGRIVNIGSGVGIYGYPGDTAYGAGKGAIVGFSKSLALEVAKRGITVNVVVPGFVRTKMTGHVENKNIDNILADVPMGRAGEAEEIASMVTYLVDRGTYVTRQVIMVNGGRA